jgi:hypothetical protein
MGAPPNARTFDFFGYTIFEATEGFTGSGSDCFVIIPTEEVPEEYNAEGSWSMNSPVYSGCRAGGFPAIAQVTVNSDMPDELRAQFPADSALQFVYDGDRFGVFLESD